MKGIIVENISNLYKVEANAKIYDTMARGKFKKDEITPVVGDKVEIENIDDNKNAAVIEKIYERKTYIKRPKISNITQKTLQTYKDHNLYILNQDEIESIYSENGKVYVRYANEVYSTKNRLYEIENLLDNNSFIRISNSEIINFDKVKNIDFKIIGTLIFNFKSGNKAYSSRRYIPKIKKFLEI